MTTLENKPERATDSVSLKILLAARIGLGET
jgi:hypothetical protein